jgi:hypothetical protein
MYARLDKNNSVHFFSLKYYEHRNKQRSLFPIYKKISHLGNRPGAFPASVRACPLFRTFCKATEKNKNLSDSFKLKREKHRYHIALNVINNIKQYFL